MSERLEALRELAAATSEVLRATRGMIEHVAQHGSVGVDLTEEIASEIKILPTDELRKLLRDRDHEVDIRFMSSLKDGPPDNVARWLQDIALPCWGFLCREKKAAEELYRREIS